MSYSAMVYKVMIASPTDLASERVIVRDVLSEWNAIHSDRLKTVLLPVAWETHSSPTMGDRPQEIVNAQILRDCDLLVGVFWTRIGTPTGGYASGTVEEIEEHLKTGKPVMLYFSNVPVRPDSVDEIQYSELKKFRASCESRGLCETYTDLQEFKGKFYRQLQITMNKDPHFAAVHNLGTPTPQSEESSMPDLPSLSREAQVLVKEASEDPGGQILCIRYAGGMAIQTHGKNFVEEHNPRSEALWEGAIRELEAAGLIVERGYKGEVYSLTSLGYEISDMLRP